MDTSLNARFVQNSAANAEGGSICSACEDFEICVYRLRHKRPILFCEEFKLSAAPHKNVEFQPCLWDFIPAPAEETRRGYGSSYMGLCWSCARLSTCNLVRPGGGTWHCPYYEKLE